MGKKPDTDFVEYAMPHAKTWWAKQLSRDLYTAGRLSERQLKLTIDAGFKSIVSVSTFDGPQTVGGEALPSTERARYIVEKLGAVQFAVLSDGAEASDRLAALERLTGLMESAPKPMMLFCSYSDVASLLGLLYLGQQTVKDADAEQKVDGAEVFVRLAALGYDFTAERELVAKVCGGGTVPDVPAKPFVSMPEWYKVYWLTKPVYGCWYDSGQIQNNHFAQLKEAGFKIVLNTRRELVSAPDDKPTQEEVVLLNVVDETGPYKGTGRQTEERLKETRVVADRSNEYIEEGSAVNFESRNGFEFGDDIGYNEQLEKKFVEEDAGMEYILTPVGRCWNCRGRERGVCARVCFVCV